MVQDGVYENSSKLKLSQRKGKDMIDPKLLDILACPSCKEDLIYDKENKKLICEKCRLKFLIKDDIPIMLLDQAERF